MRVDLKSGEYYDFFQIRKILLTGDTIEVEGNFEKGKKYKKVKLNLIMIDSLSLKNLRAYMKNIMKRFDFEGKCAYCESEDIWIVQKQTHRKEVNNPKPKFRNIEVEDSVYYCNTCKLRFTKENMKYSDVIMYYN